MKPTKTMELRAIRAKMNEAPPPAPAGASMREWFAGLAFASNLMDDVEPGLRAREAVRLADELVVALRASRVPTHESLAAPTPEEMAEWDEKVASKRVTADLRNRETIPQGRLAAKTSILPPPMPSSSNFPLQRPLTPIRFSRPLIPSGYSITDDIAD
jgi:hypothetical protein